MERRPATHASDDPSYAQRLDAALQVHSPAYSCYAADELAETLHLSPAAFVAVQRLKWQAWIGVDGLPQGFLPADEETLANMTGLGSAAWRGVREAVLKRFPEMGDGFRFHPALAKHRLEQAKRKVDAGKGGATKAANAAQRVGVDVAHPSTDGLPTPLLDAYRQATEPASAALPTPLPTRLPPAYRNGYHGPTDAATDWPTNRATGPPTGSPTEGLPEGLPNAFSSSSSPSSSVVVEEKNLLSSSGGCTGTNAAAAAECSSLLVPIQGALRALAIRKPLSREERARVGGWELIGCPPEVVLDTIRRLAVRELVAGRSVGSFAYLVGAIEEAVRAWQERGVVPVVDLELLEEYRAHVLGMLQGNRWVKSPALTRAIRSVKRATSVAQIEAAAGALPIPAGASEVGA